MSNTSLERPRLQPTALGASPTPLLLSCPAALPREAQPLTWAGATRADVVRARAQAVTAWLEAVSDRDPASGGMSREAQFDHARRVEALNCVTDAIREHGGGAVAAAGEGCPPRVVIAHRLGWFADRLAAGLNERGLTVVSKHDDGAEALGVCIAEQPDLLVLQDVMVRVPAEAVLTEVRRFAARTAVAVQVEVPERAQALRNAGARAPFPRTLAPAAVASCLADLLAAARFSSSGEGGSDVDLR